MNEQMQKLEIEAIAYADSKVPANNRYNDIYHSIVRGKFAQLIVRECLGIIDEEGCHEGGSIRSMEAIKEHFGVEE
jgi:hypothetical protein